MLGRYLWICQGTRPYSNRSCKLHRYPPTFRVLDKHPDISTRPLGLECVLAWRVGMRSLEWGPNGRFIWRVEQLLIIYGATVATYLPQSLRCAKRPLSPFGLASAR